MKTLIQGISNEEKQRRFLNIFLKYKKAGKYVTDKDLSDALNYDKSTLNLVLHNNRTVPDVMIYKFCEYFDLHPAWFFGRETKLRHLNMTENV